MHAESTSCIELMTSKIVFYPNTVVIPSLLRHAQSKGGTYIEMHTRESHSVGQATADSLESETDDSTRW